MIIPHLFGLAAKDSSKNADDYTTNHASGKDGFAGNEMYKF